MVWSLIGGSRISVPGDRRAARQRPDPARRGRRRLLTRVRSPVCSPLLPQRPPVACSFLFFSFFPFPFWKRGSFRCGFRLLSLDSQSLTSARPALSLRDERRGEGGRRRKVGVRAGSQGWGSIYSATARGYGHGATRTPPTTG